MLTSFTLTNYRSFTEPTRIELRPLTLLFGYNNAGKSSLLRALPLIAESILDSGRSPLKLPSATRGTATRGGSFSDLISRLKPDRGLGLELEWDEGHRFEAHVEMLPESRRLLATRIRSIYEHRSLEARWIPEKDDTGRLGSRYELREDGGVPRQARIEMRGLTPNPTADSPAGATSFFTGLQEDLRRIAAGVQWLSSVRAVPDRFWTLAGAPPLKLGSEGEGFVDVLFYDQADRGGILDEVSHWFERHFEQILSVHESTDNKAYVTLSPASAPSLRIPLSDTGEGMAQVLPVLVALGLARRAAPEDPQLLALEQPEIHLHPEAEIALSERLAETAAAGGSLAILVETHSENLLLGIQLQILKGLSPDKVIIYWVERLNDGSSVARPLTINRDGEIRGWPPGVFSEDTELARELYQLRRTKKKAP